MIYVPPSIDCFQAVNSPSSNTFVFREVKRGEMYFEYRLVCPPEPHILGSGVQTLLLHPTFPAGCGDHHADPSMTGDQRCMAQ